MSEATEDQNSEAQQAKTMAVLTGQPIWLPETTEKWNTIQCFEHNDIDYLVAAPWAGKTFMSEFRKMPSKVLIVEILCIKEALDPDGEQETWRAAGNYSQAMNGDGIGALRPLTYFTKKNFNEFDENDLLPGVLELELPLEPDVELRKKS